MFNAQQSSNPTILVAPLNWGLGHATRCVPLIKALNHLGAKVIMASDGSALNLLKAEFPHLPAFQLPSYRIRYHTKSMIWNIARQIPRISYAIRAEKWATERLVREHGITGIISDNRYGCFCRKARSVLLTHQIHLRVPNAALQWLANQILRQAFRKFDTIWVPDVMDEPHLSGDLSHPPLKGFDLKYIGLLSRFSDTKAMNSLLHLQNISTDDKNVPERPFTVAVVLSGPEPQRSYLEGMLLEQALALPYKFVFVKGKTRTMEHHLVGENVEVVSYLTTSALDRLLQSSQVVVCRAGYSSLMDLAAFANKKAILIPTPGQTEQEYLGELVAGKGLFICQKQGAVDLENGLKAVEKTTGFLPQQFKNESLTSILEAWLGTLKALEH